MKHIKIGIKVKVIWGIFACQLYIHIYMYMGDDNEPL